MAKKRTVSAVYEKAKLLASGQLGFSAQVLMRVGRGSLRGMYLNKLGRQERKRAQQLPSENSGKTLREWQRGY